MKNNQRKLKPAKFDVYYNGDDYVLMIKQIRKYNSEPTYHVIMETAYAESSYEVLTEFQIKDKYHIELK